MADADQGGSWGPLRRVRRKRPAPYGSAECIHKCHVGGLVWTRSRPAESRLLLQSFALPTCWPRPWLSPG